jgi:exopolysaccharide biosynthesis polyprenyl glycosylphosphotransferase
VYLGGDLAALVVAHMAAVRLIHHLLHIPLASMNPAEYHRYYIPFFAVVLLLFDGYKTPELRRPERELELGCKAVALTFLGLMPFNFLVFKSQPFSRYLLVCWFVVAGVLLLIVRFALRGLNIRLWKTGVGRRRTVLLGPAAGLAGYSRLLSTQRHHAYELLGWIPGSSEAAALPASSLRLPVLGSLEQWEEVVQQAGADLLVVASSACPDGDDLLGRILHRCKGLGLDVELYSSVLAASDLNYEMDEFSGCFRLFARPQWALALQRFVKRVLDLAIGLVGSLVTVVLVPIIGLLIKLDDGGPIFYRSAYLGQDGRNRYYLKFRTMRADADQVLETDENLRCEFRARHKLMNDPRVTRVGRFLRKSSLDEFPQFFSVIKKDLTFVGPRTIRQDEAAHYGPLLGKLLSVRPGLTGFWQAMGRQTTTYEERVRMDMFYIDHWSIWLDLWIVAKTFWKVLRAEGAY